MVNRTGNRKRGARQQGEDSLDIHFCLDLQEFLQRGVRALYVIDNLHVIIIIFGMLSASPA